MRTINVWKARQLEMETGETPLSCWALPGWNKLSRNQEQGVHPLSVLESRHSLSKYRHYLSCTYRARAAQAFWTLVTIQHGVAVAMTALSKGQVKTEVVGRNRNTLGRGWNAHNHKSGHVDKDPFCSRWGHKNSERGCASQARSPARCPLHQTCSHRSCLA